MQDTALKIKLTKLEWRQDGGWTESDGISLSLRPGDGAMDLAALRSARVRVEAAARYRLELEGDAQAGALFVNGEMRLALGPGEGWRLRDGREVFGGRGGARLFENSYGCARLELRAEGGISLWSEPLVVGLEPGQEQRLRAMIDAVLAGHRRYALRAENTVGGGAAPGTRDILDHINLIERVERVYRRALSSLGANPHTRPDQAYRQGDFERLHRVTPRTLGYISTHPEELRPRPDAPAGIDAGGTRYLPRKTMLLDTRRSLDCYENRVILGFLERVAAEVDALKAQVRALADADSAMGLVLDAIGGGLLSGLGGRLAELRWAWRALLPVEPEPVPAVPRPTAVFMAPGPYRQLYDVMVKWFRLGEPELSESAVYLAMVSHRLYEYYLLYRIADRLAEEGFRFTGGRRHDYPSPGRYLANARAWRVSGGPPGGLTVVGPEALTPGEGAVPAAGEALDALRERGFLRKGRGVTLFGFRAFAYRQGALYAPARDVPEALRAAWAARLGECFGLDGYSPRRSRELELIQADNRLPHDNLLEFARGDERVALYYQPVVYGEAFEWLSPEDRAGIPLRRTTTLNLPSGDGAEDAGRERHSWQGYWLPDYLLRYSDGRGGSRWLVVDAKYRPVANVWNQDAPNLAFKYLFAMRPDPAEAAGVAPPEVLILYGRGEPPEDAPGYAHRPRPVQDLADFRLPEVWIAPCLPGGDAAEQADALALLTERLTGRERAAETKPEALP